MKTIIANDYDDMSKIAMHHMLGYMFLAQNRVNISITGGKTPARMYEMVIDEVKGKDYFDNVHYYNFDEIPHKKLKQEGITMTDLRNYYFTPAGINEDRIHALSENNYEEQDKRIKEDGGLDVIIMGIGADGHYCGNLPNTTKFKDFTTRVDCDDDMKKRIGPHFTDKEDIPDFYVTMGPSSIMQARNLIIIANGTRKAEIMKKWYETDIDILLPASILKTHPNLTVIMDKEAASLL